LHKLTALIIGFSDVCQFKGISKPQAFIINAQTSVCKVEEILLKPHSFVTNARLLIHKVFFSNETLVCNGDGIEQNAAWLICSIMANEGAVASDATTALSAPATLAAIVAASTVAIAASSLLNKSIEASAEKSSFAVVEGTASAAVAVAAMQPTQICSMARHFLKHLQDIRWIAAALLL